MNVFDQETSALDIAYNHSRYELSAWDAPDWCPPPGLRTPSVQVSCLPRFDLKPQLNLSDADLSKAVHLASCVKKEKQPKFNLSFGKETPKPPVQIRVGSMRYRVLELLRSLPPGVAYTTGEVAAKLKVKVGTAQSVLWSAAQWMPEIESQTIKHSGGKQARYRIRQDAEWQTAE